MSSDPLLTTTVPLAAVPYAYAAVTPSAAPLVFTAGACPLDEDGRLVAPGDLRGQTRQVLDNLEVALTAAGAALSTVVKTTIFVASVDRADLSAAWDVVHERFGDHQPPSTLLGVTVLGFSGQLVEIEAIAVVR